MWKLSRAHLSNDSLYHTRIKYPDQITPKKPDPAPAPEAAKDGGVADEAKGNAEAPKSDAGKKPGDEQKA